jgi:hypothetical protein
MDKLYFLIIIGAFAVALVSWLASKEKKHDLKTRKQKARALHQAQVFHHRLPTLHHGLPSRTTSLPPHHIGAWEMRHQRAGEEKRHGSAITAERIFSDEETPDVEQTHGLAMPTIKYVPEDAPKVSQPRR